MKKKVLDVGQCDYDHANITAFINKFAEAEVVRTHGLEDSLSQLKSGDFDLVLINRKLDRDHSDGMPILKAIKTDPELQDIKVMLVSNLADAQREAEAAGALPGFGKAEYHKPESAAKVKDALAEPSVQ
ncbi:Response regulator PleD [Planctomycetales bacterium 10988]|nr:Response regulator PleD [Planctomycetales bacterium 10988]